jgi:hypothetical protein
MDKQLEEVKTPKNLKSEEERLLFLRSLLAGHPGDFYSIVGAVAAMEVCLHTFMVYYEISDLS